MHRLLHYSAPSLRSGLAVSLITAAWVQAAAAPPLVVETPPQTPDQQREQFQLPAGFQIELIASEPDIGQPMNLAFDAAGRLWVTHSVEYPYPVAGEGVEPRDERFGPVGEPPPRDRISVISGIGTDQMQIRHFATGLNIPIGILPLSPDAAISFSIPDLVSWQDTDADGHADGSPGELLGPFGNVDTHGMVNGLTRWIDGWVYACHGFRNTSTVAGDDGHEITMNSGNTFRFLRDGSRVEQYTWGQVNPFGMTFDRWGHFYTADCHSRPLTCLIPGAYYQSFGKPHDGLGFGPDMIEHSHGSTGICGPCYYAADQFPAAYQDCLYLCNPVTGRVHRDRLIWNGSSPQVDTQPDFLTCRDGWFRPVDLQLGPDGALYIADFYNAIIGHYEVPLEHPRRDRTRGRIWRVTWNEADSGDPVPPDLTAASIDDLIAVLGNSNLTLQVLAAHWIADRHLEGASDRLRSALQEDSSEERRVHALWLLRRSESLTLDDLEAAVRADSPLVRTHAARILGSLDALQTKHQQLVTTLLAANAPRVARAAAEAIAAHPHPEFVEPLLRRLPEPASSDTHLRHTIRIALRNTLELDGTLEKQLPDGPDAREIASVCLAVPTDQAASYLLGVLAASPDALEQANWTRHIAVQGNPEQVAALVGELRSRSAGDLPAQISALRLLGESGRPKGRMPPEAIDWAEKVATRLLKQVPGQTRAWEPSPASNVGPLAGWDVEVRSREGGRPIRVWSSFPGGEQGVGIYRSPDFPIPATLTFWLAGHDGFPEASAAGRNRVRLVRSDDGRELRSAPAPRQDAAVQIDWDLSGESHGKVSLELIDGLSEKAYAWIAAGDFSIDELNPPQFSPSRAAAELIGTFRLVSLRGDIERLVRDFQTPADVIAHLGAAHLELQPDFRLEALWALSNGSPIAEALRRQLIERDSRQIDRLMTEAVQSASAPQQLEMAEILAGSLEGAGQLVELISAGRMSARVLRAASIQQKLAAVSNQHLQSRIRELIANLPPANDQIASRIQEHQAGFRRVRASATRGREVFKKSCAACHQIGREGQKIGPQLDGVGIRGLARLLEDILDPNRNVDAAFRSTTLVTDEGRVLTGLLRSDDGDVLVFADTKGKEFRVPRETIEEQSLSGLSLMPEDLGSQLPEQELYDLLAYLLEQTTPRPDVVPGNASHNDQ